ncbi:MAG: F0F1 ATP synthase subunit A [Candidatus Tectomicrobia bacterium]|nr:F0F1 ATP synthase subunit A [Candidatus Tectomicrobia bacterium]
MEHPLLYLNYIVNWLAPGFLDKEHVTYTWFLILLFLAAGLLVRRRLERVPRGAQNVFEAVVEGITSFMDTTMGHGGSRYFPLIGALAFFILLSNLMGIIPGGMSPTSNINTNAACALTVFLATHYVGFKTHGIKYVRHFTGPIIWLAPLMMPIEIIGHLARPLSLSVRLFGNIRGEDLVIIILVSLVPLIVPLPMFFLAIFTSIIQTFVFCLLSMIYIAGAMEHAH